MPQLFKSKTMRSQLYQHRVVQFTFWRVALICDCVDPVCVTCGVHNVQVWMLHLPWGHFGVYIALGTASARFDPFKLLRMRKKVGMSPMSFEQCISVTSDSSKWPSKSAGSSHQWLHCSAERGTCASGAFLLVCPTEVMDMSRGCILLTDKLNLSLVIAWNTTCGKLDKLSHCAAACVYPKATSSEGCSAWVQCKAMEQDPTCVGFFLRKKKRGKAQWIPGGQPK